MSDAQSKVDQVADSARNQRGNLLARINAPASIAALASVHPEICLLPLERQHAAAMRLLKMAYTACTKNAELLKCAPDSIIAGVVEAAQLGLSVDGVLGHAYLVPYWNGKRGCLLAQFQIGYRGYVALAHRSDQIERVAADTIHANDEFDYAEGSAPFLKHRVRLGVFDEKGEPLGRGDVVGAYALATIRGASAPIMRVLTLHEILQHRALSKSWQAYEQKKISSNPWADHFPAMAMKTALRMIAKLLPSEAAQRAEAQESARDTGAALPPETVNEVVDMGEIDG